MERICDRAGRDSKGSNAGKVAMVKVLVVRDSNTKSVFAHVVPRKGVSEDAYAVDMLVADVMWLGYSRVILKSDNEPSIKTLLGVALRALKVSEIAQVMEESPPPYDSQANGGIEIGCKLVRGMVRTLKGCLEERVQMRIPADHPMIAWVVQHAALLLTTRVRGHDGKTAWERVRGKPFGTRLMGIGEHCRWKLRSKEPIEHGRGHRFNTGTFVGMDRLTGQYMLYTADGIRFARTVLRMPTPEKFKANIFRRCALRLGSFMHCRVPVSCFVTTLLTDRRPSLMLLLLGDPTLSRVT